MFQCRYVAAVVSLFAPLLAAPAYTADVTPADLVLVQQGTMPIILTAPHGGREAIPGIPPREDKSKDEAFRKKLLSDPKKTLHDEGFHPSDAAVDFFKTLHSGNFDAAAKKVKVKGEHDPIEPAGEA